MKIPKSVQADVALLAITVIWGSTFAIVKSILIQISPVLLLSLRFWIAGLAIVLVVPRVLRGISLETLRRGGILCVLVAAGFLFQTVGLRSTSPSRSAFITSLVVLFVPLLEYVVFRHRPKLQTLLGVALATFGLALLTLNPREFTMHRGDLLTVLCAFVFAMQMVLLGRYLPSSDFRQLALLEIIGSAVICSILLPLFETPFIVWDARFVFYLLVTAVLATALAVYVQNSAQRFTTPSRAALIFSLEPFFAALFSYLILGQVLTGREWIGGCMVLGGILISEIRRREPGRFDRSES
jgi:drug/metabolite transporter (DMT)-like permease